MTTGQAPLVLPATTSVLLVMKIDDSPLRPPQFVVGAHGSHSVVVGACTPRYVEVPLAPIGAYRLLAQPLDELSGQLVDLHDVLGVDGAPLGDMVRDAQGWQQRFDGIERFLLDRLDNGPPVAPEVAEAWRRLNATGGRIAIRALADGVGWSHKHLITKFRQQVGLAPKRAARLVRFERVLRRIDHPTSATDQPGNGDSSPPGSEPLVDGASSHTSADGAATPSSDSGDSVGERALDQATSLAENAGANSTQAGIAAALNDDQDADQGQAATQATASFTGDILKTAVDRSRK